MKKDEILKTLGILYLYSDDSMYRVCNLNADSPEKAVSEFVFEDINSDNYDVYVAKNPEGELIIKARRVQRTLEEATGRNKVEHPSHYNQGKIECIEAIESATSGLNGYEGYLIGNTIKYAWRWFHKNGEEDLKKAKYHIDLLLKYLNKE